MEVFDLSSIFFFSVLWKPSFSSFPNCFRLLLLSCTAFSHCLWFLIVPRQWGLFYLGTHFGLDYSGVASKMFCICVFPKTRSSTGLWPIFSFLGINHEFGSFGVRNFSPLPTLDAGLILLPWLCQQSFPVAPVYPNSPFHSAPPAAVAFPPPTLLCRTHPVRRLAP